MSKYSIIIYENCSNNIKIFILPKLTKISNTAYSFRSESGFNVTNSIKDVEKISIDSFIKFYQLDKNAILQNLKSNTDDLEIKVEIVDYDLNRVESKTVINRYCKFIYVKDIEDELYLYPLFPKCFGNNVNLRNVVLSTSPPTLTTIKDPKRVPKCLTQYLEDYSYHQILGSVKPPYNSFEINLSDNQWRVGDSFLSSSYTRQRYLDVFAKYSFCKLSEFINYIPGFDIDETNKRERFEKSLNEIVKNTKLVDREKFKLRAGSSSLFCELCGRVSREHNELIYSGPICSQCLNIIKKNMPEIKSLFSKNE